jgi:hypothetical protein
MRETPGGRPITVPVAVAIYAYAALVLALPFIADADPPFAVFVAVWVGGSALAGALIPHTWVFLIPVVALVLLLLVMFMGYSGTEFLSDPLSSIALLALTMGEWVGLALGYTAVSVARSRRSRGK